MDKWLTVAYKRLERMPEEAKQIRERAMIDLVFYAQLVNPGHLYGEIQKEAFRWMQDYVLFSEEETAANKLLMFPRAHMKSHMVATWASWMITKHPEVTILYLSATAELAESQLYSIKCVFESDIYQRYWPEYINPQEGNRAKWTERKIIIDHPQRKLEGIRDATIATAGLTTNTTGWHADIVIPDDLVIPENAYTEDGRSSVAKKSAQFSSIRNPGGFTMACGTRYHPSDIYSVWIEQVYSVYTDDGDIIDRKPIWEVMERVVEIDNTFLWPRAVRSDGKAFGFNINVLSRIREEYGEDPVQFYAQYYNDPNDPGSDRISRDKFQYYDPRHLKQEGGKWQYKDQPLNVYASIDFAYSLGNKADYTAIVVIGIDPDGYIYVMDIDRFKTDKISEYFKHIKHLHARWEFKKIRAEITTAQAMIVDGLKDDIRRDGLRLSVDPYRPPIVQRKEERIAAALEHRYDNLSMWHHKGGYTAVLEEELVLARPPHDDIKDALASVVEIAIKPKGRRNFGNSGSNIIQFNSKFGGVRFR